MKQVLAIMLLLSLLCSCETRNAKDKFIVIDLTEKQEIALSDVIRQVRILPLIMSETDLLGNIKDVCTIGDTVYILDDLTASLWAFDKNSGRLITQSCHRGNGPNEYVNPIAITSDADKLYLLDLPTNHIISYNKALDPLETVSFPFPASDFIATDDGFFLHNLAKVETLGKVVRVDRKGVVNGSHIPFPNTKDDTEGYFGGVGKCFMKSDGNIVFFSEAYSNKIYVLDTEGSDLFCQLDFMNYNPPADRSVNHIPNLFEQPYALCDNFFILENCLVFGFLKDMEHYYCFYEPSKGILKVGKVRDDKDGLPFFPRWQSGRSLVGTCLYGDIKERLDINKYSITQLDTDQLDEEMALLLFYDVF
jgi:hypothetical protein